MHGLLILLVLAGASAEQQRATEPDFYLVMQKCRTTVGYLVQSDESLKTIEGTSVTLACTRRGKAVSCVMAFEDGGVGHKGNSADYTITLDSPPLLLFSDGDGGDWIAVDTAKHAAVVVTRVADRQFVGARVCQGVFATQSEMEAVRRKK